MKSALLLSGGMDSVSLAFWKQPAIAITINYGQLAADAEIEVSKTICNKLNIQHEVIRLPDLRQLGSGDMSGQSAHLAAPASDWWPFRNQMLLSLAAMSAIRTDAKIILIGTVLSDSTHLDGTQEFIDAINSVFATQEGKLVVNAPAIRMSTAELVRESKIPLDLLSWAHSCHKSNLSCGNCRGCFKYVATRRELGIGLD